MRKRKIIAAVAFVSAIAVDALMMGAYAQSESDMVIMRRSLDPKTRAYAWIPGEWSQCSNSCGPGQQTRSVQCLLNGAHNTPEVNCTDDRPADTQACYDIQACSYTWKPGQWSDVAGCGEVVETRSLTCLRGDGETVPNDQCSSPAPETSRTVRDLRTCSYEWKTDQWSAFSSECQTGATSTRNVWCERSNGEKVADSECADSGGKLAATQTENRYGQCSYSWEEKPWSAWSSSCQTGASRTRQVVCKRSNGEEVADSFCALDGAKPATSEQGDQYGSCTYKWEAQSWGAVVPACGSSTRSRVVQCIRSNGDVVDGSLCDAEQKPAAQEAATDYSTCTYSWNPGSWSAPSSTCGAASSTRSVTCLSSDGRTVADSFCSGTRPSATNTSYETSGCGYSWQTGEYGNPVPACGATVQNRIITCLRSDGQTVSDGLCPANTKPAASKAATDYSTCTYGWTSTAWGAWSTSCGSATQTRTVTCESSDGRTVADSFCSAAGVKPIASQSAYQTSGCGYSWQSSAFGAPAAACGSSTQTRSVWCQRSDNQTVADSFCSSASKPALTQGATDYSTCSYSWDPGSWSAWSTTCGSATQTRTVTCLRSDGTTVADASCSSAGAKPTTSQSAYQVSGCGYTWQASAFGAPTAACGATTQTRSVWCQRSDNQTVADSFCGSGKPTTTQGATDYSTCSYDWNPGSWSAWSTTCGNATQTRSVTCLRSDGTTVADTSCASAGTKPTTSQSAYQVSGCGYTWQSSAWGSPAAACGASTQTRSVWCQRSDNQTVADSFCGAGKPATSQGATDYSACGYSWAYSGWTTSSQTCGTINQTRSVWCKRSDGQTVVDSYCGAGKPASTQSLTDYSACTYSASSSQSSCSSGSMTVSYSCRRSDGVSVSTSFCGVPQTASQSCTSYAWRTGGWGGFGACQPDSRQYQYRSVYCEANTGGSLSVVSDSLCGAGRPGDTNSQACTYYTYSWYQSGFGGWDTGCGNATQYQTVYCRRSPDGAQVGDAYCGGGKPASSNSAYQIYSCSYTPNYNSWSPCYQNNQSSPITGCTRGDGAQVSVNECTARGSGSSASRSCTTSYAVLDSGGFSNGGNGCTASNMEGFCTGNMISSAWSSSDVPKLTAACQSQGAKCCALLGSGAGGVPRFKTVVYDGFYSPSQIVPGEHQTFMGAGCVGGPYPTAYTVMGPK